MSTASVRLGILLSSGICAVMAFPLNSRGLCIGYAVLNGIALGWDFAVRLKSMATNGFTRPGVFRAAFVLLLALLPIVVCWHAYLEVCTMKTRREPESCPN